MKGSIFVIIAIWVITLGIGVVVWETKTDIIEGLSVVVIITALLSVVGNSIMKKIPEPKKEYYIQW